VSRAIRLSIGVVFAFATPAHSQGDGFEKPPVLSAADAAPPNLAKGNGFQIADRVPTDGLTTQFTLSADVGTTEVHGVETLALRVSELPALRELGKASKTATFTKALAETAKRPVKAAAQIVQHPVETAKGIPSGLSRFFDRVGSGSERLYDAATDSSKSGSQRTEQVAKSTGQLTMDALGYEQERRKLAKQLGVDPYTTNLALAKQLDEFAKVAFYGRVGLNTLISVVVPASLAITGTSATRDLIYDTPRGDLIVRNENALRAMGVSDPQLRALQAAPGFTLSVQTELVEQLAKLDGVAGRPAVVALAGTLNTSDQALFLVRGVRILALQHAQRPLAEVAGVGTVFARAKDGTLIVPAAVDYVSWTERASRFARRTDLAAPQRTVLLTGRATPLAKQQLTALGWRVAEGTPE
jgi:hypothetical protein